MLFVAVYILQTENKGEKRKYNPPARKPKQMRVPDIMYWKKSEDAIAQAVAFSTFASGSAVPTDFQWQGVTADSACRARSHGGLVPPYAGTYSSGRLWNRRVTNGGADCMALKSSSSIATVTIVLANLFGPALVPLKTLNRRLHNGKTLPESAGPPFGNPHRRRSCTPSLSSC